MAIRLRFSPRTLATLGAFCGLTSSAALAQVVPQPDGIVPVRYSEGVVHGFLELRSDSGVRLAHGELIQVPRDSTIESLLRFFFRDGSRFEETVEFTQHRQLRLKSYRLVQRGPAFPFDLDARLNAGGKYEVTWTSHDDGKTDHAEGAVDAPADLANGLPLIVAKNLRAGDTITVHLVAFTPKPMLIGLRIGYAGKDSVMVGAHAEALAHWALKPELGTVKGFFAKLLGKLPPDTELWIDTEQAPTVVRVRGPLYTGPVWRIDLSGAAWVR